MIKLISDPKELYRFLSMPGIEVINLVFANDEVVWVTWEFIADDRVPSLRHTNEVKGAYVTAVARIYLYRYLDLLQKCNLLRQCLCYMYSAERQTRSC